MQHWNKFLENSKLQPFSRKSQPFWVPKETQSQSILDSSPQISQLWIVYVSIADCFATPPIPWSRQRLKDRV